jgi:hypothetical protein
LLLPWRREIASGLRLLHKLGITQAIPLLSNFPDIYDMDTSRDRMRSLLVVKFREKKYRFKLPWWHGWKWFVGGLIAAVFIAIWIIDFMKP